MLTLVLVKSEANEWSGRMQMGGQIRAIHQQPKPGTSALLMGPLGGDSDWGNSNPDVFTDSSGYRGFRLRLGVRSVGGQDNVTNLC